jgi:ubiquinone/menaquinone biosynthesis C-methylase UbiE
MEDNLLWIIIIVLATALIVCCIILFQNYVKPNTTTQSSHKAEDVGNFYNEQTDNFLKVYGTIIQAFRTTNVSVILNHQVKMMGLKKGMRALDAGCGICGPAVYFAQETGATIEAITISQDQVDKAVTHIKKNQLENKINVQLGDYHSLSKYFPSDSFDIVYFLESFGHAVNHEQVLNESWGMLKPGGTLYIKDLFIKESNNHSVEGGIATEINNINKAYKYNVANLYEVLRHARKKGFIVAQLSTIDIPLEEFENLTISNDFQELTGINKIENLQEYIFPVDFFELKLIKPWNSLEYGNSRYFLQNLFYMQVHNRKQEEL